MLVYMKEHSYVSRGGLCFIRILLSISYNLIGQQAVNK